MFKWSKYAERGVKMITPPLPPPCALRCPVGSTGHGRRRRTVGEYKEELRKQKSDVMKKKRLRLGKKLQHLLNFADQRDSSNKARLRDISAVRPPSYQALTEYENTHGLRR
ncbi:hypothetical protein IAQ61_005112 [Plenodomus lingam]|uniref:uncharacterized protein n=1 Tax=Leptosphaeria maculans TaxID=5022 RepID=UPI003321772F|nr:hypothetical protein IAQ61_005112 [Plenodomus lingam]